MEATGQLRAMPAVEPGVSPPTRHLRPEHLPPAQPWEMPPSDPPCTWLPQPLESPGDNDGEPENPAHPQLLKEPAQLSCRWFLPFAASRQLPTSPSWALSHTDSLPWGAAWFPTPHPSPLLPESRWVSILPAAASPPHPFHRARPGRSLLWNIACAAATSSGRRGLLRPYPGMRSPQLSHRPATQPLPPAETLPICRTPHPHELRVSASPSGRADAALAAAALLFCCLRAVR